jgi:hypothetical protein
MLSQQRSKMSVRDQRAPHEEASRYFAVHVPVTFLFRKHPDVWQTYEGSRLATASSGDSGRWKIPGCVAMRRYAIAVLQARQKISVPEAQVSRKVRAR